jgi:hypothetical protein
MTRFCIIIILRGVAMVEMSALYERVEVALYLYGYLMELGYYSTAKLIVFADKNRLRTGRRSD